MNDLWFGLLPWNRGHHAMVWTPTNPDWREEFGSTAERAAIRDARQLASKGVQPGAAYR